MPIRAPERFTATLPHTTTAYVVGANGNIYTTERRNDGDVRLIGLVPELAAGQTQPTKVLDIDIPDECGMMLYPYKDGIMLHGYSTGGALFYSYGGQLVAQTAGSLGEERINTSGQSFYPTFTSMSNGRSANVEMYRKRSRANGEGSIFPYRNGYAAYAWVTTPNGRRKRKYVYGKTREDVHAEWIKLQSKASKGPVATKLPTVGEYLDYWITDVIKLGLQPKPIDTYGRNTRLYIKPWLAKKRLHKLSVQDVRKWLADLAETCQCCVQGKDARRAGARLVKIGLAVVRSASAAARCCLDGRSPMLVPLFGSP